MKEGSINRREAIRNIALASVATMFVSSCADRNVVEFLIDGKLQLDRRHKKYLSIISETILPTKDVSEKIGDPVDFILTMLNDCTLPEDLQKYVLGFEQYKQLMVEQEMKIKSADPDQVIDQITTVLEAELPQEELIHFINTTKDLSIWNLKSSEYYKVEFDEYRMIPASYQACITI